VNSAANNAYVGGLVGLSGIHDSYAIGRIELLNSRHIEGEIKLDSTTGEIYLGGAVGFIGPYTTLEDCSAETSKITLTKAGLGNMYIGGFAGQIYSNVSFNNCFSNTWVYVNNGPGANNWLDAGGFAGNLYGGSLLESCYALAKVDITAPSPVLRIGGLVGYTGGMPSTPVTITQCYASGDVTASSSHGNTYSIGGLVGYCDDTFIANCYALGNVTEEVTGTYSSLVDAGGLVGTAINTTIEYCFAKERVEVVASTVTPSAGGIVGRQERGALTNNAALGDQVYKYPGSLNGGRVLGLNVISTPPNTIITNNYALSWMSVSSTTITDNTPNHGLGKTSDVFYNTSATWRTGLGFNQSSLTSVLPWNLTSAATLGYPTLTGLGGQ
jgi:hypothetical protein